MPYKSREAKNANARKWRAATREKRLAYERQWRAENRQARTEYQRQWREENRDKVSSYNAARRERKGDQYAIEEAARTKVNYRIRCGLWPKPKVFICTDCGSAKAQEYHHEDYNQWWNVEPLCRSCHLDRHSQTESTD